jgi:hypothetical protein
MKGWDRMLQIWHKVIQNIQIGLLKFWKSKSKLQKISKILNIDTNVVFFDPVKKYYLNIEKHQYW